MRVKSCRNSTASAPAIASQARYADALDLVAARAGGGVDDVQRHALDLYGLLHPCRAWCRRWG